MEKNINIVIAGLGTVGTATIKLLEKNKYIFSHKFGLKINIVGIFAKDKFKKRDFKKNKYKWFNDPIKMIEQKKSFIQRKLSSNLPTSLIDSKQLIEHLEEKAYWSRYGL